MPPSDEERLGIALSRFGPAARSAAQTVVLSEVTAGLVVGENPLTVARRISRRAAGITLTRAATIARTEMAVAGWTSHQRSFARDRTVIEWQWRATKDGKTCPICSLMHGKRFPKRDRLRSHPNCRCTMTPVTRAGAPIPPNEVGTARVANMSDDELRRTFGPSRARYLRAGGDPDALIRWGDHPLWGPTPGLTPLRSLRMPRSASSAPRMARPTSLPDFVDGDEYARHAATIRGMEFERNVMFTRDGRVLTADGDSLSAPFTADMTASQRGSYVLHNHPGEMSFSPQDITSPGIGQWSGVEAVTAQTRYVATPGPRGWPDQATVLKAYRDEASATADRHFAVAFDTSLSDAQRKAAMDELSRTIQHRSVQRLADEGWIDYVVEPLP